MPRYGRRGVRRGARRANRVRRPRAPHRRRVARSRSRRRSSLVRTMPTAFRSAETYNRRRIAIVKEVTTDVNSVVFTNGLTGGQVISWFTFDPSGTIGNSSFPGFGQPPAISPSWLAMSALYKWYKCPKVVLTFRVLNVPGSNVNLLNNAIEMFWRHDYDYSGAAPTATAWMESLENVKRVRFTAETPQVKVTMFTRI